MSDVPAPQPGDHLRRVLERLRAARARRGDEKPSSYEEAFAKGHEGEHRFGSDLNAAAARRGGCWVLHGLVVPDKMADIDHLVIGPAGVTAIDSKAWTGKVWIGRLGLGRGRRASRHEIDGMSRQINRVHTALARSGRDDVPVTGVICMVNANDGVPAAGFADIRGVRVGRPNAAIHHALRDGPFDVTTIEIVKEVLANAFGVHGGAHPPTPRAASRALPPVRSPRRLKSLLRARRAALAILGGMVVLAGAAAIIGGVASVPTVTKHYRAFTRDDLRALGPELRALAVRRAHGRVHGPKLRVKAAAYVLTYRRGRHCRVVLSVSRAWPLFGGGKPTATTTGCKRRG